MHSDPEGEPGTHWIALWVDGNKCELFDSYALPLNVYGTMTPFISWLEKNCVKVKTNKKSVQVLTTQTCGFYAFFYLLAKSRGKSMRKYLSMFDCKDFLANDKLIGVMLRQVITDPHEWRLHCCKPFKQCNC